MAFALDTVGKKLWWGIAVPGLLVVLFGITYFWRKADAAVRQTTGEQLSVVAEVIAASFTAGTNESGAFRHTAVAEALRQDSQLFRYVSSARIVDRAGKVRWSRQVAEEGKPFPEARRLLESGPETVRFIGGNAEHLRPLGGVACAGCHLGDTAMKLGTLQVVTAEPLLQREVTAAFQNALLGFLGFALVLAIATMLSLRTFLTRPLSRLAGAMRRAETGDFLARAEVGSRDEIGALASAFNRMLARITSMKAEEIDTHRDLAAAQEQLSLKQALEATNVELEHRVSDLSTLYEVARSLTSTLDLPELFSRITQLVAERLHVPQFSIMILNDRGQLEVQSAAPAGQGTEGLTFDVGEGVCGRAAERLKPQYLPDLERDGGVYRTRERATRGRGSLLAVPMVHMGTLLGVLNFERPEKAAFSHQEIELLTTVADQAAMAVKNARLHAQTVELSITDPLTGIPNRRHLFTRLEMEIARANRFGNQISMLMIDIDHFKHLNDAAGHRAGDIALRQVCDLMKGMTRKVDTLGRYGGEEFVVLLPQVTKEEALEVAEKIRDAVATSPLEHAEVQPGGRITVSIGVSNLPVDSTEQDRLVDCADSALYASKRGGRDRVTGYARGMELHPGRERGPHAAAKRTQTGEQPLPSPPKAAAE